MKLFRFGPEGKEKPGVELPDGKQLDVSDFGQDYTEDFFAEDGIGRLKAWLADHKDKCPEVTEGFRFGPVVKRPSKLICIGLNYAKHAAESGMDVPKEPVVFFKATSSIVGPNDPVVIPRGSEKTDWEVELAVVIGKKTSYVTKEEAMNYVAGYALHNDYSERAYQLERGGQWVKGKSCDTFAPLGPYLVTADEELDPHNLNLWLKVNGETLQNSNTSDFIFDIPTVISYLSEFMTLLPGDVISTGTPAGVGLGFDPPRYLKPGDVVELGIEGLGSAKQEAKAYVSVRK
ncbi:fumarylacetoacetate hydrolase family protein [Sinomicrobium weinanense]|uniref:Fumarylacetoacetate hydrolase family protein n=1 Tax=Sinomicrobium weinanense TaxID=2842200 RepID=A0A926JSX8_9FLAO|nr:fumarylacetoacetate hydrolase family protein [Sinomicrobium weinanense]MBC9796724.1 fumarylacetoacetate hydrolase family protein [Sinomicrobium weinanense]MBU3123001.1 fumarylacetoacetate hydrolase family protein [Sinomicrobium weinanense]